MYKYKWTLTDLSEIESVSITGGETGDLLKGVGWVVGAIGGAVVKVVKALTPDDYKMSEAMMLYM